MELKSTLDKLDIKLTDLRQAVLNIFIKTKKPLKAYDILNQLKKSRDNAEPTTVYRVLEYFLTHHLIHRIESDQSYTLCHDLQSHQDECALLMHCQQCHAVTEIIDPILQALLRKITQENDFLVQARHIELSGCCHLCQ